MGDVLEQIVDKHRASSPGETLVNILNFVDGGVTTDGISYRFGYSQRVQSYLRFLEDKQFISKDKKYRTTGLHNQIAEDILPYALEIMLNPKQRGKFLIQWDMLLRLAEPANINSIFADLGMNYIPTQRGYLNDLVEQGYIAEITDGNGVYYQITPKGDNLIQSVRTVLKEKFDYEDKRSVKIRGKKQGKGSSYVGETLDILLNYAINGAKKWQINQAFSSSRRQHHIDFLVKHGLLAKQDDEKYYPTKLYWEADKDILPYALGIVFDPKTRGGGLAYYDVLSEFSSSEPRTIGYVCSALHGGYDLSTKRNAIEMAKENVGHLDILTKGKRTYYTRTPKGDAFLARIDSLVETLKTVAERQAA